MSVVRHATLALAVTLAGTLAAAAEPPDPLVPRFADDTAGSGVSGAYQGDWEYMVGGGATSFDCDDDGFPDLLLAGGTDAARFYRNVASRGGPLHFQARESGLELTSVTGAYALDVDSDARTDVLLLRVGENVIMRGLGGCRFERANEAWGLDGGDAWSTAATATFERGSDWPTIAVGNYIDRTKGAMPWGSCTANWLHRPLAGGGGFGPPVALEPSFCALSILFTDWNRSGVPALRVSNDREYYKGGQEQLWRVEPGQGPVRYTEEDGWRPLRVWGMGIAAQDLDDDGYPEYFLTSMADNKLQKLMPAASGVAPRPTYGDIAFARGVTAHRPYTGGDIRPSTAWHAQFEDVNHDGLADLFVAKGNVAEMPDFAQKDPNNLLIQGADGTFREVGQDAGVASFAIARGATLADFNLDGLIDIVVANRWTSAEVLRNTTEGAGHWLHLRLERPGANRDGIGAFVEVKCADRIMRREITVGGGHAGGHFGWWHFGLADGETAEVRVLWPDGTAGSWQTVAADGFYVLSPDAPPRLWTPGKR